MTQQVNAEAPRGARATLPILRIAGVTKSFPGVQAIRAASLEVYPGEVHALVGENGAGKSTLIKVVTGAHHPDQGRLEVAGQPVRMRTPGDAFRAGIAAIYQEFNLVPALTARENLFLGRERTRSHLCDTRSERRRAREIFARLGARFDPEVLVRDLTVAQQQLVEIARALLADARILIMDEPTAALTPREVDALFAILGELRRRAIGVLFISHRLNEVFRLADRVTIMRDGVTLGTWPVAELTREQLIERMVGRPLDQEFPKARVRPGAERLRVENLRGGRVPGASFTVRAGEIVGIAGLVGAGRTELARLIFGADRPRGGRIWLDGEPVTIHSPGDAIRQGVCLLTEDRQAHGLILGLSARENFALPNLARWSRWGWISQREESRAFLRYVESLKIRVAGPEQAARHLSGGNQQKLLVARWLESDSRVLIFDEPTRGIDVGAKHEMYLLLGELAARGKAVIVISSELPEILGMSDRILVMRDGVITGEIAQAATATQEQVLELAVR